MFAPQNSLNFCANNSCRPFGEDPYLTSRMGVQVVKGLQGTENSKYRKLYACAKHYAVHSGPEWSRHQDNITDVSPRDLYETYLPAFKALVQQGNVREVMCAYQRLDDEPCCGNTRLLLQILRDEWGFKHIVASDCGAIRDFYTTPGYSLDATHFDEAQDLSLYVRSAVSIWFWTEPNFHGVSPSEYMKQHREKDNEGLD